MRGTPVYEELLSEPAPWEVETEVERMLVETYATSFSVTSSEEVTILGWEDGPSQRVVQGRVLDLSRCWWPGSTLRLQIQRRTSIEVLSRVLTRAYYELPRGRKWAAWRQENKVELLRVLAGEEELPLLEGLEEVAARILCDKIDEAAGDPVWLLYRVEETALEEALGAAHLVNL